MKSESDEKKIDGSCAVLGLDVVAFSILPEADQIASIQNVYRWITESLANHSITEETYRWSPAGDGGFLTFNTAPACRKAIDVAFTLADKVKHPDWTPESGKRISVRMGLHSGLVKEAEDLGQNTNIWGVGINTTSRILAISGKSQLLVSRQYYETYIAEQREEDFEFGSPYSRTVKHGAEVEIMNANRHDLALSADEASNQRWQSIAGLWRKTIQNYTHLIHDAMRSGDPIAAMASAKFLLDLKTQQPVKELCQMIGRTDTRPTAEYPAQTHILFGQMPPDLLFKVIEHSEPRLFTKGEIIYEEGDPAKSCFFPVSGTLVVDVHGQNEPIAIQKGQMTGEFSLWIPNISRTGRVRALDDGMFLEIHIDRFRAYLEKNPEVMDVIYEIIRQRILENALTSKLLFPELATDLKNDLAKLPVVTVKHRPGETLDLTDSAYAIFSGKVSIEPPDGSRMIIGSSGQFRADGIVGIVSEIGTPDGTQAKAEEETVCVRVPHEFLREAQSRSDALTNTWNAICGQRLGMIRRAQREKGQASGAPSKEGGSISIGS